MEYIILEDVHSEVQKKLNQWKHNYDIEILHIRPSETRSQHTYVALIRTTKAK